MVILFITVLFLVGSHCISHPGMEKLVALEGCDGVVPAVQETWCNDNDTYTVLNDLWELSRLN